MAEMTCSERSGGGMSVEGVGCVGNGDVLIRPFPFRHVNRPMPIRPDGPFHSVSFIVTERRVRLHFEHES